MFQINTCLQQQITTIKQSKKLKSQKGVLKLLQNINENKATGPDNIPDKLLKIFAEELSDVFTFLFQNSLNKGKIPDDWSISFLFLRRETRKVSTITDLYP